MDSARASSEDPVPDAADLPSWESRLALGGLLAFVALLPVQVWMRIPGLGASAAVWPGDAALAVSVGALAVGIVRGRVRLQFGVFGVALCIYALCIAASVAASDSVGRSMIRATTARLCRGRVRDTQRRALEL